MNEVYIVGAARTAYGRFPERTVGQLARAALDACVGDAGAQIGDIEAVFFANAGQGATTGQHTIRGQVALRGAGLPGVPIVNVENACASGASALHLAVSAIRSGQVDVALALGAEQLSVADRTTATNLFDGGIDIVRRDEDLARLGVRPGDGTVFMGIYAALAERYGLDQRQLAAVTAKNRGHAARNPYATYRTPLTVEEICAARVIAPPLTKPMCAPIGDGAAAILLCGTRSRFASGRAVRVRATALASATDRDLDDEAGHISGRLARMAYEQAGLSPDEISLAEVHDATAVGEILQTRFLGLADGDAAARGDTALGGRIPVNTSGGLECNGHPIGATGLGQIHELVTQLRGEAGARQVARPRIGLAENGGGFLGVEEAAAAITILEAM
ncbi:acetyl-CoA acetyltransferase [Nocardia tenerifensis]|uniref:Acetyl-CoA acetyltransferase n=1 Tax=Nocardia tenerifensis TaxID=228006 RepID=A0A318JXE3_9NOCA|nr:thiolase family protein [Nocardia tenerifensis]PXX58411.1 acetyl-CoA acetyltransferase [Nocardia tenerifensis]